MTSSCWFCNEHGRPTYKNVRRYLDDYNLSLMPGGVNAHLGIESSAHKAEVYLNDGSRKLVAVALVGGWLERANKAENNPRSINPPQDRCHCGGLVHPVEGYCDDCFTGGCQTCKSNVNGSTNV